MEAGTERVRCGLQSAPVSGFLELAQKYGTDKVSQHGNRFFYPRFLEPLRDQEFTMLEIGYHEGASARM